MKRKQSPARLGKGLAALGLALALAGCSAASVVTQSQATEIALEHAGVDKGDVQTLAVKLEQEDGRQIFDIQFSTDSREYHCDVTRSSGEIVNYSYGPLGQVQQSASQESSSEAPQSAGTQEESQASQASQTSQASKSTITQEEAQAIALEHARVTQAEATIYKVKADQENGRGVYDVEFAVGTTEYDYEIAQDTGEILSYDSDVEGWTPETGQNGSTSQTAGEITREQAIQLVLERVPGATSADVKIEEDYDDGRKVYEGEVYYNRAEYEFEITSNGNFIEWSVDYDD
ncbi:MAG: PepSY domain-containing protein [Acutalibacter sp.]|jgi:uncharacterized membrane protein YkoI